jgi:uncharacterized membrane protein
MIVNLGNLKQRYQLKDAAKSQLKGAYWMGVLVVLLYSIISGTASNIPFAGLLLIGPLTYGISKYFLLLKRGENPQIENLFDGFNDFARAMVLGLLITLFTVLWSLLFIIPGIIAAMRYSQAYYILMDNPEMSAKEALEASKQIMAGNVGRYFVLCLSFLGWFLLCIFTFFIGYLFLMPYIYTVFANFYEDLRENLIKPAEKIEA